MLVGLAVMGAVAGSLTCGGSASRSNGACVPGVSVACAGPAQCAGYQVCSEDGSSLSPCMCTADAHTSDASDGGADGPGALPDANGGLPDRGGGVTESGSTPAEGGYADGPTEGGTGACNSGTYSGLFTCTVVLNADAGVDAGMGPTAFAGTIALELTTTDASSPGVGMVAGSFSGNSTAGLSTALSAGVSGSLSCGSGTFGGALTGGTVSVYGMTFPFSSTLASEYDGSAFVNGALTLVFSSATCPGTWSASYAGP
jgi:hypothetical protein